MGKAKWILVFCIFSFVSFGQNQSANNTHNKRVENVATLAKVWGFLKYYHPNVAKGDFNWDEQLFKLIPKVEDAQNKEDLSKIYLEWIARLGIVKECKSCKEISKKDYFDKNFNLSWINNSDIFTTELSQKLKYIEENRFQGNNYYVTKASHDNIEVRNESQYTDFEYPDQNHRLLSLFRYWNTVEYFFPYKYLTDQNWDSVLLEMIPKFENSSNATEYQLVMLETVIKLDDSHAFFYSSKLSDFFGRKFLPAYTNLIENKVVITGFLNDSLSKINDIKIGDIIEQADHNDPLEILSKRRKYINGSNAITKNRNFHYLVFNGATDSINLKIIRKDVVHLKKIKRYDRSYLNYKPGTYTEKYRIDENNIGYINSEFLGMKDVDEMMQKLNSTNGIVIDLRKSLNFTPYKIAKRLIQSDKEFAKFIKPDLSYPGKFLWEKPELINLVKNQHYSGKIVLLVNEQTQSSLEYAAMLLQSGKNVTTIGSQTAGADGDVSRIEFLGFESRMSGLGVFYPDGTQTQRIGIKVDIEVHPTIKGMQEGRDEVLEAAKAYLISSKI